MAVDPVCGMYVDESTDLKAVVRGRTYYFCSRTCMNTFLRPEAELKKLKRDTAIALALATPLVVLVMVVPLLASALRRSLPYDEAGVADLRLLPPTPRPFRPRPPVFPR